MLAVTEAPIIFLFQPLVKQIFFVIPESVPIDVLKEKSFDL